MKLSKLKNGFNKNTNHNNQCKFKIHQIYYVRKPKQQNFSNRKVSSVTGNKSLRKSAKPHFSNRGMSSNKIELVQNDFVITNNNVISKTVNTFFINPTKTKIA